MATTPYRTRSLEITFVPVAADRWRVDVAGDLDALTVNNVSRVIGDILSRSEPHTIKLNLAEVEFLDIAATTELRRLHRTAAGAGCVLSVDAATPFAWWLFAFVGLSTIFTAPEGCPKATEPGS